MILKDKIAVITGASSGIGAATALLFAKEGANLVISYKENKSGADEIVSKINELSSQAFAFKADLTKDVEAKKLIEFALEKFGQIDIVVNNAGRYIEGDEWNGDSDVWEESIKQNLVSVMSVSKYAIEVMQKQKSGLIVNIASRHSVSGQYDALSYAASKAGVVNITQAFAKLLAPWGRANAISPGAVKAGYWLTAPKDELENNIAGVLMQKLIEPEDIAEAALFLASDRSQMITGQNILVDGGFTLK